MDGIELACHIDSGDAVRFDMVEGDARVEMLGMDFVYLNSAAQERLYAWLGKALSRHDATAVTEQRGGGE